MRERVREREGEREGERERERGRIRKGEGGGGVFGQHSFGSQIS